MNNNEISFLVQRPKAYYKPLLGHKYNSQLPYFSHFSIKNLNKIIRKNFSLILCKNYGKIEEWPMGDSNPQPEI